MNNYHEKFELFKYFPPSKCTNEFLSKTITCVVIIIKYYDIHFNSDTEKGSSYNFQQQFFKYERTNFRPNQL